MRLVLVGEGGRVEGSWRAGQGEVVRSAGELPAETSVLPLSQVKQELAWSCDMELAPLARRFVWSECSV